MPEHRFENKNNVIEKRIFNGKFKIINKKKKNIGQSNYVC